MQQHVEPAHNGTSESEDGDGDGGGGGGGLLPGSGRGGGCYGGLLDDDDGLRICVPAFASSSSSCAHAEATWDARLECR